MENESTEIAPYAQQDDLPMSEISLEAFFFFLYNLVWDFLSSLTLLDYLKWGFVIGFFAFILVPYIKHVANYIHGWCHPIRFSYKHVLITGCGTGLGRCLV